MRMGWDETARSQATVLEYKASLSGEDDGFGPSSRMKLILTSGWGDGEAEESFEMRGLCVRTIMNVVIARSENLAIEKRSRDSRPYGYR